MDFREDDLADLYRVRIPVRISARIPIRISGQIPVRIPNRRLIRIVVRKVQRTVFQNVLRTVFQMVLRNVFRTVLLIAVRTVAQMAVRISIHTLLRIVNWELNSRYEMNYIAWLWFEPFCATTAPRRREACRGRPRLLNVTLYPIPEQAESRLPCVQPLGRDCCRPWLRRDATPVESLAE